MGRRLRTKVPAMPSVLEPNVQDTDRRRVQLREDEYRSKQQTNHDEQHQAHALLPLTTGEQVWVRDQNRESDPGIKQPRSYLVKTDMSKLRRNRSALVPTSSKPASPSDGPTMAPSAQALPVNHTPPKVSTPKPENLPVEPSTPIGPTTAVSTQEDHPNTRHSISNGACYTLRTSSETTATARSVNI